jgi:hypothetical protein
MPRLKRIASGDALKSWRATGTSELSLTLAVWSTPGVVRLNYRDKSPKLDHVVVRQQFDVLLRCLVVSAIKVDRAYKLAVLI